MLSQVFHLTAREFVDPVRAIHVDIARAFSSTPKHGKISTSDASDASGSSCELLWIKLRRDFGTFPASGGPRRSRAHLSTVHREASADREGAEGRSSTHTSRIRSPLRTPALSAAPRGSTALTCCSGAYNSPLMLRNCPPSLTWPRTLNPKPVSVL